MRVRFVRFIGTALVAALASTSALASAQSTSVLDAGSPFAADVAPAANLGGWIAAAPVPGAGLVRYGHAQCLGEDSFYVISGVLAGVGESTVNQRYDAATNTWTPLAPVPVPSQGPSGVCYEGKIYLAGGGVAGVPGNQFLIYDIASNTWSAGAPVPRTVWGAAIGAHNGRVYLAGGDNDFGIGATSNVLNVYDIASNTWLANGPNMPLATLSSGFGQLGSSLYVVGGFADSFPQNAAVTLRLDMETVTWQNGPAFTTALGDGVLAVTATALWAIGGDTNGGGVFDAAVTVERLDLSTWPAGTWTASDPLPAALTGHKGGFCTSSFFPASGEVWSAGGFRGGVFQNTNQYLGAEACASAAAVAPAALEVDPAPAGNRVLEPNEAAVVVAPSWENTGSSAIAALTGTATAFTGPAGATYTINDSTANYGAVGAGATASCQATGNCYTVTVAAASRPVVHWDSTLTETVTPTGATKDWILHIGNSFTDVATSSPFYRFIETLLHHGVTGGCTTTTYCPTASTTRDQMAVFVLVAFEGAGYTPPACVAGTEQFADVPATSPFCRFIEELANRGVVAGCDPTNYCPSAPATREQMAVFVLRTLDPTLNPPACVAGAEQFGDVPSTSPFCRWVEELANRGVVTGCGGGNYCPTAAVTREQMAVFLSVTFGLLLYGV